MRKLIITAFLLLNFCFHAAAQLTFHRIDSIKVTDLSAPLSNAWAGGLNYPMFFEIDLNGDNIMDMVAYENGGPPGHNRIMPFLNGGTPEQVDYHFAPQYISHFPNVNGFMMTYDYNHDGKMDLFSLSDATNSGIMVYRNDYASGPGLQFTMIVDPILSKYGNFKFNVFASQVKVPALADVDNDGDMDIISWNSLQDGMLHYQKGLAVDSGWSYDSLRFKNVTQCWGGFALETYNAVNNVHSFGISCRLSEPDSNFHWDTGNGAGLHAGNVILIYDNDGDGDKEALIGDVIGKNLLLVVNGGSTVKDSMVSQDENFPSYNTPIDLEFPSPFYLDVDNDGVKDLIVTPHSSNDFRGVLFYKNNGTTSSPVFALQPKTLLQEDMIEVGTTAVPSLFDYDADGLPDLLIGNESRYDTSGSGVDHKGITLYKNTGTPTHPMFQLVTRDYAGIDALNGILGTIYPTFGDLDGDGDIDMIAGYRDGKLLYFENTAGANNPANFIAPSGNYQGIDVGQFSAPQLYDLNHDGRLDLIIGNSAGLIKYYQNTGTVNAPAFSLTKDTLGGIIVHYPGFATGYATPFIYNDDATDKLILGIEAGKAYVYDDINGNIPGNYHRSDSLINGEEGQRLVPFVGDINHDGHPDLLVGNYNGGVSLFMNTDTTNLHVGISPEAIRPSFDIYPNPASGELHLSFYHMQASHAVIEIVNNIGQVVYKTSITGPRMTIPLDAFANGIYVIRFINGEDMQLRKFILQKR